MGETVLKNQLVLNEKVLRKEKLNLILFLEGKLVSLLGTNLYTFILALYILKTTGSGLSFAFSILAGMVPRVILGPFAGVLADKVDRKKIVVLLDFLSGGVVIGLLIISYLFGLEITYIYIVTVLLSIISTFFDTTISASIPNLVTEKNLTKINSYAGAIGSLTGIIAPVIGGMLFGLITINLFLLLNAVSFFISAITEMFIDFKFVKVDNEESIDVKEKMTLKCKLTLLFQDIKEVFNYIKNNEVLYILIRFAFLINFVLASIQVIMPFIINNVLKMTTVKFGIIETSFSVGFLLASIIIGNLPEKDRKLKSFCLGLFIMGICAVLIGIPTIPILSSINTNIFFIFYILIQYIFGVCIIVINVPMMVSIQKFTPDNIRGRVMGIIFALSGGIAPLGIILSGLLIDIIPSYIIPMLAGLVIISCSILIRRNKAMKEF